MKKTIFLIVLFSFLVVSFQAAAQQVNMKWNGPSSEEMAMTSCAVDPEAEAVVLLETRQVFYDFSGRMCRVHYQEKCRIKVLKEEGKQYANQSVTYLYNQGRMGSHEVVTGLKAAAYNMVGGKMVKTKMEGNMVINEDISKHTRKTKFTIPQVNVGTVIEYEYHIVSDFYYQIDDWVAQWRIPVLYTNYKLTIPEFFDFNVGEKGMCRLEYKTSSGRLNQEGIDCATRTYSFVGRDLPGVKDEPFVFDVDSYRQTVSTELRGIQVPGGAFKDYATTWDNVDNMLLDDDDFGGRLGNNALRKEMKDAAINQLPTVRDKVVAVLKLLRSKVKWNGKCSLAGAPASEVLKEGTGSNASINMMAIAMLKEVGVDAFPVALRTRDDGPVPLAQPGVGAFNSTILGYVDGTGPHYYDAAAEYGYIDVLPAVDLVEMARVVKKDGKGDWVSLAGRGIDKTTGIIDAVIDGDGLLTGTSTMKLGGIAAASAKKDFAQAADSATYVNAKAKDLNVDISAYSIANRQDFGDVAVEHMTFDKQFDASGDLIYVNPMVLPLLKENPFKSETRQWPIDFPCASVHNVSTFITIPSGWTVEELPKPLNMSTHDGSVNVIVATVVEGDKLLTRCSYSHNKLFFLVDEYKMLRTIYEEIAMRSNQLIALKKVK